MAFDVRRGRVASQWFAEFSMCSSLTFLCRSATQWQVLTIFASAMGPAEVAAWAILGLMWNVLERITAGFADTAEVRVGFYMGAGQPRSATIAAYKLMFMALMASLFSTVVLFIIAGNLPRWMTPDPTLQKMVRTSSFVSPALFSSVLNSSTTYPTTTDL